MRAAHACSPCVQPMRSLAPTRRTDVAPAPCRCPPDWGGFRVLAVDSQRGVVSRRPKHCFFMLAGPRTPLRVKARGLLHMGAIASVLQQAHVSFEVRHLAQEGREKGWVGRE